MSVVIGKDEGFRYFTILRLKACTYCYFSTKRVSNKRTARITSSDCYASAKLASLPGGVQLSIGDWTKADRLLVGMGSAIFSSLCLASAACTASVWMSTHIEQTVKQSLCKMSYCLCFIDGEDLICSAHPLPLHCGVHGGVWKQRKWRGLGLQDLDWGLRCGLEKAGHLVEADPTLQKHILQ